MKFSLLTLLIIGLACGLSGQISAQTPTPAAGYRLGPGDGISIQVINFPELSAPPMIIPPDGKIAVPIIKSPLFVTGKTIPQVSELLTEKWSNFVVAPSVTVTLTQQRKQIIRIYGHVAHEQTIDYTPEMHLVSAIAEVGGVAEDGDATQVTVTRADGFKQTADLSDPQNSEGSAQDLELMPDDVIYVPERHTQVSVLGEVVKPGSYDYTEKMTVLDALKDANNINPETADLSQAILLHNGKETPLDLKALLNGGKLENNVMLAAGDSIFIPTLHNRIYVDGAVNHPGYYAYKPDDRLVDAINGSGGTQAGASDLAKVNLIHMDKLHDTATVQTIDVMKFYRVADMKSNPMLAPGDAVYVPIKGQSNNPLALLGNVLGIGNSTRIFMRPGY